MCVCVTGEIIILFKVYINIACIIPLAFLRQFLPIHLVNDINLGHLVVLMIE